MSIGFSAKYSTYSFMDDATKEIVHFELVQVNQHASIISKIIHKKVWVFDCFTGFMVG